MTTQTLKTRVNSAIKTAKNNSKNQHDLLVDCLDHARTSGDWTLLARLVNGLTATSVRAMAIKTWVETFSPYNSATDDTGAVRFTMPKNADKRRPWMMEDAKDTPFWELTVEKESKGCRNPARRRRNNESGHVESNLRRLSLHSAPLIYNSGAYY